jgi:hypothetical protein
MNVTHSTEETNRSRPGLINLTSRTLNELNQFENVEKWDNGTGAKTKKWDNRSINDVEHITYGLMDKLCKCALVLIKHKVGTDLAVSDCMVRALEEWLRRKGITIYTEQYQ